MRICKYPGCFIITHFDTHSGAKVLRGFENNLTPCHILGRGIMIDIYRAKRKRIFKQI